MTSNYHIPNERPGDVEVNLEVDVEVEVEAEVEVEEKWSRNSAGIEVEVDVAGEEVWRLAQRSDNDAQKKNQQKGGRAGNGKTPRGRSTRKAATIQVKQGRKTQQTKDDREGRPLEFELLGRPPRGL
jgi:hypothetical protein